MYELIDTTDNDHHDTGTREEMITFARLRNEDEAHALAQGRDGKLNRWAAKPAGYSARNFSG